MSNDPPQADFEEDPRYRIAVREMGIGVAYWLAFTAVVSLSAWLIGGNKEAEELTFILGFPDWFFWSCLVSCAAFSILPFVLVRYLFTDMPLSPDGRPSDEQAVSAPESGEGR
jgi:uncharacterized membrane protein YhdT